MNVQCRHSKTENPILVFEGNHRLIALFSSALQLWDSIHLNDMQFRMRKTIFEAAQFKWFTERYTMTTYVNEILSLHSPEWCHMWYAYVENKI